MARFIPNVRPEDVEHDSERLVLIALAQLSDEFVVLHSFPWLRPRRGLASEPLTEGEADFIVLHADRGLLVLEVKGGQPELRQRTWYRGHEEMRDPFAQAQRNRYALLDAVEDTTNRSINRGLFTHGDVVVFPHCVYAGQLPLNTDRRTFLDGRSLADFAPCIEAAFQAWARHPTALSQAQFNALLQGLMPPLRLMRCVGADLAAEGARIVQATEDQVAVLRGLLASDRVLVEGAAGSGKTLLALEFAVSLAAGGSTVLLLCFNRHLATWLQEQVAGEPRLRGRETSLEIATFHSHALSVARRAQIEFEVPSDREREQQFWDEEVPLILEQGLELLRSEGRPHAFDAVVVDEAQDFAPDWWVTVESLTRDGRTGRLYALLDLHQCLRGQGQLPTVPLPVHFPLRTNCRNTKAIARTGARLLQVDVHVLPATPEGEVPVVRGGASQAQSTGIVLQELRGLLRSGVSPRQIALLGPAAHPNGGLARFQDVDGIPFTTDAAAWRRGQGILVSTAASFKGLEADVVLLYDGTGFGPAFTLTHLYVAWTRARHRLIAFCHGVEVRSAIEAALA